MAVLFDLNWSADTCELNREFQTPGLPPPTNLSPPPSLAYLLPISFILPTFSSSLPFIVLPKVLKRKKFRCRLTKPGDGLAWKVFRFPGSLSLGVRK